MATEVYLVRHGETMFNQLNKVQGWCDSPLTVKGINDLKRTANALSQVHFDNMYSSDLKRAIDTVHLMKDANVVSDIGKIRKLPEFREVFFGTFEGDDINQTWDQVAMAAGIGHEDDVAKIINKVGLDKFREATKKADPRHLAENTQELDKRMIRGINVLRDLTKDEQRVLLVTGRTVMVSMILSFQIMVVLLVEFCMMMENSKLLITTSMLKNYKRVLLHK